MAARQLANGALGGLGLGGTGPGGGGTSQGTIGLGNIGRMGNGSGIGTVSSYGSGAIGRSEARLVPRVRAGSPEVRGGLSPEVVSRIARRHINELRFCYERELLAYPELGGEVRVRFVIDGQGSVPSSTLDRSTLGNPGVEACIVSAVRRWRYPAPDDGQSVRVVHPFLLSPARSESGG